MIRSSFIVFPVHALFWCTLALIAGIFCAWAQCGILIFLTPTLLSTIVCLASTVCKKTSIVSFVTPLLVLSCFYGGSARFLLARSCHQQMTRLISRSCELKALIIDAETIKSKRFSNRLTLKVLTAQIDGAEKRANTIITLYLQRDSQSRVGDIITIKNLALKPTSSKNNPLYFLKEGIAAVSYLPFIQYTLLKRPKYSLRRSCVKTRNRIFLSLSCKLSRSSFSLFQALFLGTKEATKIYQRVKRDFTQWGIVHYLARSGLHMVVVVASWGWLLRFLPVSYFIKQLFLLLLIILYHLLSWPSISFVRAFITIILYKLSVLQVLSYQALYVLCLTTFLVLIYNPFQLFFLDFQLSFGLTFALAWFNERAIQVRRLQAD